MMNAEKVAIFIAVFKFSCDNVFANLSLTCTWWLQLRSDLAEQLQYEFVGNGVKRVG